MITLPDLSEFQPGADMAGIKRANGGAAVIRACYGNAHTDREFKRLRNASHNAGFAFVGIYQYLVASQSVASQAAEFCAIVGKLAPHEVPILDLEEGDGNQSARAVDWLSRVGTELGRPPWLYSGLDFAETHGLAHIFNGPEVHTWVAAYGSVEPQLGHTLWQSTDGKVGAHITDWPGAGRCDTNVYHGSLAQLRLELVSPPAPGPESHQHEYATIVTDGKLSLHDLAASHGTVAMHVLRETAAHFGGFPAEVAAWGNAVFAGRLDARADMPAGLHLRVPVVKP